MKVFAVHQKTRDRVDFDGRYVPQPWAVTWVVQRARVAVRSWRARWHIIKALFTGELPVMLEIFTNYAGGFHYELLLNVEVPAPTYPYGVYDVRDDKQLTGESTRFVGPDQKCDAAWRGTA